MIRLCDSVAVISIFKPTLEHWVLGVATVAEASDKAFCSGLDRVGLANLDKEDPTLARIRQLAEDGKDGYSWKDKVLVHRMDDTINERVFVPEKRRKGILKKAHSNKLGGHFSYKKTVTTLKF